MGASVKVGNATFSQTLPFALIAGPCQMESRDHALMMATNLAEITDKLNIPFIYKTSFDKANRTSLSGKRGFGLENSLAVFREIKEKIGCPVLTDVHTEEQCKTVAEVVDVLQIPAFLCRQTDLLLTAGNTGKVVNVKKGQFLAPWDMKNVADKVASTGNKNILLTERGASFGYNTLVVDFTGIPIMAKETGYPIIMDCTHAVQKPGGQGTSSGGNREMAPVIAKAAVAVGVAGLFMEVHQDPDIAPSDGPNMINLHELEGILKHLKALDAVAKSAV
jgi:2-dehydro-3-deoxyphosphooctonate aldolase (KDO 8-P synthase)